MKKIGLTALLLLSLSFSAFAASKVARTAMNDAVTQDSRFDLRMVGACENSPFTFNCSLSKEISKSLVSKKV